MRGDTERAEGASAHPSSHLRGEAVQPAATVLVGFVGVAACLVVAGLLLTHTGALAPLRRWDEAVNRWFAARRTPGLDRVSGWLSTLADTVGVVAVAVVVIAVLLLRRMFRRALLLVVGLPLELALFLTVNFAVDRPRPSVGRLGSTPGTHSFPSGHVAATIVLYGGIVLVLTWGFDRTSRPWAGPGFVAVGLLASAVGLARVYRGMHHPTDVIAGACMGVACLAVVCEALRVASPSRPAPHVPRRDPVAVGR